MLQCIHPGK